MSAAVMPLPSRTHAMPRDGPATLVASTIRSRMPGRLASQLPMMVSVAPKVSARAGTEYISAVSRKFTPRSTERSRMACDVASSTCSPKVMVPRQMGGTRRALCPSATGSKVFMNVRCFRKDGSVGRITARDQGPGRVAAAARSSSCKRNTRLWTLPVVVMGRASMNSISLGYS
jgi:hypothetical protein